MVVNSIICLKCDILTIISEYITDLAVSYHIPYYYLMNWQGASCLHVYYQLLHIIPFFNNITYRIWTWNEFWKTFPTLGIIFLVITQKVYLHIFLIQPIFSIFVDFISCILCDCLISIPLYNVNRYILDLQVIIKHVFIRKTVNLIILSNNLNSNFLFCWIQVRV